MMLLEKKSLLAVVLVGSLGLTGLAACKRGAAKRDTSEAAAPVAVKSTKVSNIEAPVTLRIPGSLRGDRETDLAANASGRVTKTLVERGMQVKAGQVLAQLDTRSAAISAAEANAQAASAKAQSEQLRSECARYDQLKAKGAISELEYTRAAAQCQTSSLNVEATTARARMAAQNVGDGSIRAPFDGVVTERYVDVGEYVRQDSKVVTLVAVDKLRLEFAVPEAEAAKVRQDADVTFSVAAFPDRRFHGKVRYRSGAIRESTRDLVVEAMVENADRALMPGMFADIELEVGVRKVAAVPKGAIVEKDGRPHAFFVVDDRLEERVLSTLTEIGDDVPVVKGASPGDSVVLGKLDELMNGQRVAAN